VILTYGTKAKVPESVIQIDVAQPEWKRELETIVGSLSAIGKPIPCTPLAHAVISAKVPVGSIRVRTLEDFKEKESDTEKAPAAARTNDIVVSKRYNPITETSKVWLSTHHLELIDTLLNEKGFKVELLDEAGNVIKDFKRKG
jgi:hypothetical protein